MVAFLSGMRAMTDDLNVLVAQAGLAG